MDAKELEQLIEENDSGIAEDGFGKTPDKPIEPEDYSEVLDDED